MILILAEAAEKVGKAKEHRSPDGHFLLASGISQLPPYRPHNTGHQETAGKDDARPEGYFIVRYSQFSQVKRKKGDNHGVAGRHKEHAGYQGDDIFIVIQKQASFQITGHAFGVKVQRVQRGRLTGPLAPKVV